jgi:hypothetical protein
VILITASVLSITNLRILSILAENASNSFTTIDADVPSTPATKPSSEVHWTVKAQRSSSVCDAW